MVTLSETFGLAIADHPVEEIQRMLLVFGVSGDSQPVDGHRNNGEDNPCGDGEIEVGGEGEERTTESKAGVGQVEGRVEGSVEVGGNAGIDIFIEVDFDLLNLSHFLLLLEQLQSQQFGVVVLGVGEGLNRRGATSHPRWILCRR